MPELPFSIYIRPQMRRTEFIAQLQKMIRLHTDILHNLIEIFVGKLPVKPLNKSFAFLASQMFIPYFLRSIMGGAAYAEFYESRIIMQVIYLIVNAVVFAVCPLRPERPCLETGVFNGVIIRFLRSPSYIIS